MDIPGWAYILVGVVVAGVAGYVYKFIPRDGQPNTAMALFFFVGMIFILVGVAKFFFKKVDNNEAVAIQQAASTPMHELDKTERMNKVEQQINKIYQQENPQSIKSDHPMHHSSTYAQSHPYAGAQTSVPEHHQAQQHQAETHHASHHMSQQIASHNPPHHMSQQISTATCKKCGTVNHSVSNYCHKCGNRLK